MSTVKHTPDLTGLLPEEILCYIFSFVQINDPILGPPQRVHGNSGPLRDKLYYGLIKITFVNRRWRQAAIGDASLWTRPTSRLGLLWLWTFRRRSKSALLTVDDREFPTHGGYATFDGGIYSQELTSLLTSRERRRVVSLKMFDSERISIATMFDGPLPALQDFRLEGTCRADAYIVQRILRHAPLLQRFHISIVELGFSKINWARLTSDKLTTLNLILNAREGGFLMPQLLDALRCMPALANLAVREEYIQTSPLTCDHRCSGATKDLIALRFLKSVILESPLETHAHFLRHVQVPEDARVSFFSQYAASADAAAYDALACGLKQLASPPERTSAFQAASAYVMLTSVKLSTNFVVSLGLTQNTQPSRPHKGILYGDSEPHERFVNDFELCYHDIRASTILPLLNLRYVHTLTLQNAGSPQNRLHCQSFPSVERLRLSVERSVPQHDIGILKNRELFRMLRFVDMDASFFNLRTVLNCYALYGTRVDPERIAVLKAVLRVRWKMGSPLEAIFFHVEEEVALLREGGIDETTCRGLAEDIVHEAVERLEAIEGVYFVPKHFDPFAT